MNPSCPNVGSPRPRYLGDVGVWRTSRSDLCPSTYGSPSRRAFWLLDSGSCRSAVRRIGSAPMMIRPPAIPDISGPWLPYNHAFTKPPALDIAYLGVFLSSHSILNIAPGRFVFPTKMFIHTSEIFTLETSHFNETHLSGLQLPSRLPLLPPKPIIP